MGISLWRNQDQVDNHATHAVEILQPIVATADSMRSSRGESVSVSLNDLAAKAARRLPARVSASNMSILCKCFNQFLSAGHQHLLQELVDVRAAKVNPKKILAPLAYCQSLAADENLRQMSHLRHYLILSNYTEEKLNHGHRDPRTHGSLKPQPWGP